MGAKAENLKNYQVPIDYFVNKTRGIERAGFDFKITSENPSQDGVWFRIIHGMSMKSYGEKITITLRVIPGGTSVHVHSECGMPTQLFDMGKNKQNVEQIFGYLENGMPVVNAYQPAPQPAYQAAPQQPVQQPAAQPQPQPAQPQPAPQAARTFVFCASCGTKNDINANFCCACGSKLVK